MKKLFTMMFVWCIGFQVLSAQTNDRALFESANDLYEKAEYKEAKKVYLQLLEEGYVSDDLHYNLANTFFKTNQIANAILHYEKAVKINPANEDAAYNLELANQKTIDKVEAIPDLFIYRWWRSIYNLLSVDNWAKLTVFLFFIALLAFALFLMSKSIFLKKLGFYTVVVALLLACGSWFLAAHQYNSLSAEKSAIIMSSTVNIVSAPSEGSSQLFVLHEGTKVRIKDRTEGWLEIALPNGNEGWIKSDQLEII